MKKLLFFITSLVITLGYSQKTPALHIGKKQLALSSLDVKVIITGNIATTTYDMSFYNPSNRVLEGELKFPLAENQEVSRLALEMNGKLREAVVVEKELGRIAFEGIVRKGVDPALLEKGKGNMYKVRVYPIPAKGYKRVVIAYEQELLHKENAHYYHLPLTFKSELDRFTVAIEAVNQKTQPIIVKGEETMSFSNWQNSFKTSLKKVNYIPNKSISVKIPIALEEEKLITSPNYFYFYKTLKPKIIKRKKPSKITFLWDTSLSMKNRNLEKEIALLDAYFLKLKNVDIYFTSFSNVIINQQKIKIRKGDWSLLKNKLINTVYDGATSYKEIENLKSTSDVILLSSDGITTLSNARFVKQIPVFIINSKTESAHKDLFKITKKTKGGYINLNTNTTKEGIATLTNSSFEYLGYNSNNKKIEVYHSESSKGLLDFSVAGKNYISGEKITFLFGYGNEITMQVPVILKSKTTEKNVQIERIWAKNKINELLEEKKKNKKQIIDLATNYSLVTDYTSLIVLEDIQDYIKYNITPPEELLVAYNAIKNKSKVKKEFSNRKSQSSSQNNTRNRPVANISDKETIPSFIPPPVPERIEVVEDEKEVEETIIESTETDESEAIEIEDIEELEEVEEVVEDVPFSIVENLPIFNGCDENLTKENQKKCLINKLQEHVKSNLNTSLTNNLAMTSSTRLFAEFTIDRRGKVVNIIVKGNYIILANEVVRVLQMLPDFIAGSQRGRPVNVPYILPVTFVKSNTSTINLINPEPVIVKAKTVDTSVAITNVVTNSRPNRNINTRKKSFKKYKGSLVVKNRMPKTAYLNGLEFFEKEEDAYRFYLKQRESYKEVPHYYIDVSDFFHKRFNSKVYANRILSNIAELDADNYSLLKAFAYKLEERKQNDLALYIYKNILELRPEDAQSYRDVALAYENLGLCKEAFTVFLDIITNKIYENNKHRRIFKGLQDIAEEELKLLYQKYKSDLDTVELPKYFKIDTTPIDFRVVVDWNHNDTDIDLHIIDPNLEECYYSHSKTQQGGRLSRDMTQGFGPEQFVLRKAKKGNYYVKIKYFGDRKQRIETPTFMKVTIFKNQGKSSAEKIIRVIRLTKKDREEMIAKIEL